MKAQVILQCSMGDGREEGVTGPVVRQKDAD
jgi:hypothetical protein